MSTTVHVVRHGEVHNPDGVLYGRMGGFSLSERGREMAQTVAAALAEHDIVRVWTSPLERARETAEPIAAGHGLEAEVDPRVTESANVFEGRRFSPGASPLRDPGTWRHLWNPARPSWGEPYEAVAVRMRAAILDARAAAAGREAVIVSHQLPIWIARLSAEKRRYLHDPRRRRCTLCSVTSFHFDDNGLIGVGYSEPALGLIPRGERSANFSSGDAPDAP